MCNKCKFVSKAEVKEKKQPMINILNNIVRDHKKEFGKGLNYGIVGSVKRNLVFQRGDSPWDIDFQINVNKNLLEEELGNSHKVRMWFFDKFKNYALDYKVENSTSVITIRKITDDGVVVSSFDVALISREQDKVMVLKFNKISHEFIWNELGNNSEGYSKYKEIKGSDMWDTLRGIYLDKKCENFDLSKDEQKSSSSLLLESINETLQKY